MLNQSERFKILKIIQNFSKIGCFPVTIDLSTWQLLPHSQTGKRLWPSVAYFSCFVIHVVYTAVTFLYTFFFKKNTPIHELAIHAMMAVGGQLITLWYYLIYIEHSGVFGWYLHMTLTGNIGGNVLEERTTMKWTNRLKQYTVQDLIAISLPYMIAAVVPAYLATGIFYPKLQLLLYAGLPEKYQTWLSFTILLFEEMRYMGTLCIVAMPMWILHLISFDLMSTRLHLLIEAIKRATKYDEFNLIYNQLRQLQLYVLVINEVNRYVIFTWKVYSIGICIGSGYCAIAHFTDHPVFGVLFYTFLVDCTFIYIFIYGKAFKSQALSEQAAQKALVRLNRGGFRDMHIVKRQMRSVPPVGIQVGEFHLMERQSIPVFVHYVLSNIVGLLVAYRH